jgi:hypothetical protein
MAENLLKWLPDLTKEDLEKIRFAVRNCGSRYSLATTTELALLDRERVIAALLEANRVYGTAVHTTVEKLMRPR